LLHSRTFLIFVKKVLSLFRFQVCCRYKRTYEILKQKYNVADTRLGRGVAAVVLWITRSCAVGDVRVGVCVVLGTGPVGGDDDTDAVGDDRGDAADPSDVRVFGKAGGVRVSSVGDHGDTAAT